EQTIPFSILKINSSFITQIFAHSMPIMSTPSSLRVTSLIFLLCSVSFFMLPGQKAIHIDQKGAYLEISDQPSLNTPQMTIECWLKINALGDPALGAGEQTLIDKRGNGSGYNIRFAGTQFPLPVFGFFLPANDVNSFSPFEQKRWSHLAIALSLDSAFVFINGVKVQAQKRQGAYVASTGTPLRIGDFLGYPGGYLGLHGDIDEFRIWDYARSGSEIKNDMNRPLTGSEKGLRLYLNFESVINQKVQDLSPNKNHASIFGNATLITSKAPVDYVPLPAPKGLRLHAEPNAIQLEWEPVAGAAGYKIYRSETIGFALEDTPILQNVTGSTSNTYKDLSPATGKPYFYNVTAYSNPGQEGLPSATAVSKLTPATDFTTGVYYYPWYIPEENHHTWPEQYVRYFMKPAQPPLLGHYSVKNKETIKTHLNWMSKSGIDFIVSSWWGPGSKEDLALKNNIVPELEKSSMKFSVYYESAILGFDQNGIDISGTKETTLLDHFNYLEQNYFKSPSYLKIDNKPVVFLYLALVYSGNYLNAFQKVRTAMAAKGISLYLIGDIDAWQSSDPARLAFLDGISPYVTLGKSGYPAETNFMADVSIAHYKKQQEMIALNKLYIPVVMAGFNNICVPCNTGFNWPRLISSTASTESTLEYNIKATRPFIDNKQKMVMITSWNEWHEDTEIEPTITTSATNIDNSPSGQGYTGGYAYAGFGFKPLTLVADLLGNIKNLVPVEENPKNENRLKIYPSVTQDKLTIEFIQKTTSQFTAFIGIKIFDIKGQQVQLFNQTSSSISSNSMSLDISALTTGVYFLKINGYPTQKFIVHPK
ncbi:MAG: LamG-like jellyroll fold domain-containing protein, partial [Saprospiraceae bacterium]